MVKTSYNCNLLDSLCYMKCSNSLVIFESVTMSLYDIIDHKEQARLGQYSNHLMFLTRYHSEWIVSNGLRVVLLVYFRKSGEMLQNQPRARPSYTRTSAMDTDRKQQLHRTFLCLSEICPSEWALKSGLDLTATLPTSQ